MSIKMPDKPIVQVRRIIKGGNVNLLTELMTTKKVLAKGDFEKALYHADRVYGLGGDSQSYLIRLMVDLKLTSEDQFYSLATSFENNVNYLKILTSEDQELANELKRINSYIK